jgi:biopolymer transport protein ExbD
MGAAVSSGRGKRGGIVGINVTPMVDVVLVLLVIMMVSATYIVSQSMKVQLPKTQTSDEATQSVAAVTLSKDGLLRFNNQVIDEPHLVAKLKEAHATSDDVSLVISADEAVPHGSVVHVIDLAKIEGISKFAINVERSK